MSKRIDSTGCLFAVGRSFAATILLAACSAGPSLAQPMYYGNTLRRAFLSVQPGRRVFVALGQASMVQQTLGGAAACLVAWRWRVRRSC